jgi:hypothetical protein
MTKDDAIRMAQQWGDWNGQTVEFNDVGLERFANLVAAAERERACRIVTGLCISDNNAREINTKIREGNP